MPRGGGKTRDPAAAPPREEETHYRIWTKITGIEQNTRLIALFIYYTSVTRDQPFGSRFKEMAFISIGVAVMSFFVGILAKRFLGVDI